MGSITSTIEASCPREEPAEHSGDVCDELSSQTGAMQYFGVVSRGRCNLAKGKRPPQRAGRREKRA